MVESVLLIHPVGFGLVVGVLRGWGVCGINLWFAELDREIAWAATCSRRD